MLAAQENYKYKICHDINTLLSAQETIDVHNIPIH